MVSVVFVLKSVEVKELAKSSCELSPHSDANIVKSPVYSSKIHLNWLRILEFIKATKLQHQMPRRRLIKTLLAHFD